MIELLLNELLSTFPFHFLAYIPFYKKLKYSPLETVLRVCMCQIFYLGIFTILTRPDFQASGFNIWPSRYLGFYSVSWYRPIGE